MLPQNSRRCRGLFVVGLVAFIYVYYYVRAPSWREESVQGGSRVHLDDSHNPQSQLEYEDYYYNSDNQGMTVKCEMTHDVAIIALCATIYKPISINYTIILL